MNSSISSSRRRSSRLRQLQVASMPQRSSENSSSSSGFEPVKKRKKARAFNDVTNTASRKRSSFDEDSTLASKKRRASLTSPRASTTLGKNTVTPMAKKNTAFDDDSVRNLGSRCAVPKELLPSGVVNLYPRNTCYSCVCDENHCTTQSLSHCFMAHYGKDYFQSLKEWNDIFFPLSATGADKSDVSHASSSVDTQSFASSTHQPSAPSGRVAYVVHGSPDDDETISTSASRTIAYQPQLTEKMRAVLVDWLVELSEEYKLSERTLHVTVALLNRALECGNLEDEERRLVIQREMFQCLGCTCMWIASKMEEISPPTISDFVYISADSYTKKEITEMEVSVCAALQFRLYHITAHHFADEFLRASATRRLGCPVVITSLTRSMVDYLLELSLIPSELVQESPRKVCAGAVYLARVVLFGAKDWTPTLEHYTGYSKWDLEDIVLTLHKYHAAAEESKLTNTFAKYRKDKYHNVALKTVPREQDLGF